MKVLRKILEIDEERCDGCGQCVPDCAEGALQVVDGKNRMLGEQYCDGLGACLGACPRMHSGSLNARRMSLTRRQWRNCLKAVRA